MHAVERQEPRPRLLILSFSFVANDARILKQIRLFNDDYEVVSCGFGPAPAGVSDHVELKFGESRSVVLVRAALIRLHAFRLAYAVTPAVRQVRRLLRGRRFAAVLANDLDTAGAARSVAPEERIHLDLHEYWPGRQDQSAAWVRIRRPFYLWQIRSHARRIPSVTTVSDTIAKRYGDEFGLEASVVTNASPLRDFEPQPVGRPLRIVHSGASLSNRRIENIMRAVAAARNGATLDLYLVGEGTPYHDGLVALAEELGERVRLLPPVPNEQLLDVLNGYDVGIHVLPPTNTNNALALPNKFFDYVQARLALLIGPTASMAELLRRHDLGIVTDDFEQESITKAVEALDSDRVSRFKAHAHAAASELSAEVQNAGWRRAIERIAAPEVER